MIDVRRSSATTELQGVGRRRDLPHNRHPKHQPACFRVAYAPSSFLRLEPGKHWYSVRANLSLKLKTWALSNK